MKFNYSVNDRLSVELDAANQKDAFEQLSTVGEVFNHTECGACKNKDVRFLVRTVVDGKKEFKFYEMQCGKCKARLSFGQHSTGDTLFPKKKDDNGEWLPNNGWVVYKPENK